MSIEILGATDPVVDEFCERLKEYASLRPDAKIELYRHNPYSIRVRVIDDQFRGKTKVMRHREVWPILEKLPEDTLSELSFLVLIPPEERDSVMSSREFDGKPIASAF